MYLHSLAVRGRPKVGARRPLAGYAPALHLARPDLCPLLGVRHLELILCFSCFPSSSRGPNDPGFGESFPRPLPFTRSARPRCVRNGPGTHEASRSRQIFLVADPCFSLLSPPLCRWIDDERSAGRRCVEGAVQQPSGWDQGVAQRRPGPSSFCLVSSASQDSADLVNIWFCRTSEV